MDWANERYVRVYIRETADRLAIRWEGRALLTELMCKADRGGLLDTDDPEVIAELVRMPVGVVADVLPRLLDRDIVRRVEIDGTAGLWIRNFVPAQEAKQSDAQRQRESRGRRRARSRVVTGRDAMSPDSVTRRDDCATSRDGRSHAADPGDAMSLQPSLAEPSHSRAEQSSARAHVHDPGPVTPDRGGAAQRLWELQEHLRTDLGLSGPRHPSPGELMRIVQLLETRTEQRVEHALRVLHRHAVEEPRQRDWLDRHRNWNPNVIDPTEGRTVEPAPARGDDVLSPEQILAMRDDGAEGAA